MKKFTFLKTLFGGLIAAPAVSSAPLNENKAIPYKSSKRGEMQVYVRGLNIACVKCDSRCFNDKRFHTISRMVERLAKEVEYRGFSLGDSGVITENLPFDFLNTTKWLHGFKLVETAKSDIYKIEKV